MNPHTITTQYSIYNMIVARPQFQYAGHGSVALISLMELFTRL